MSGSPTSHLCLLLEGNQNGNHQLPGWQSRVQLGILEVGFCDMPTSKSRLNNIHKYRSFFLKPKWAECLPGAQSLPASVSHFAEAEERSGP